MAESKVQVFLEQALDHSAPSSWRSWESERDVLKATQSKLLLLIWRSLQLLKAGKADVLD